MQLANKSLHRECSVAMKKFQSLQPEFGLRKLSVQSETAEWLWRLDQNYQFS